MYVFFIIFYKFYDSYSTLIWLYLIKCFFSTFLGKHVIGNKFSFKKYFFLSKIVWETHHPMTLTYTYVIRIIFLSIFEDVVFESLRANCFCWIAINKITFNRTNLLDTDFTYIQEMTTCSILHSIGLYSGSKFHRYMWIIISDHW